MLPSVFDAAPTNSFLQNAHKKRFLQQGMPFPEEESTAGSRLKPAASLLNKQKWKMLKSLPGKHSGNTWQMMGALNTGLAPMKKNAESAEVKEAGIGKMVPWVLGGGAAAGITAGTAYGANKALGMGKNFVKREVKSLNDRIDGVQRDVMNQVTPVLDSAKGVMDQGQQAIGQVRQTAQDFQNAFKPWADMVSGLGRGLAGTFGMQGYARPQWQRDAANYSRQMYNKATDPETGIVGTTTRYTEQQYQQLMDLLANLFGRTKQGSYTKEGEIPMLTTFDAIHIAINGSEQFQKRASATVPNVPDTRLKAHIAVAEEMEKCAEHFSTQPKIQAFTAPFHKAAGMVRKGYPAITAMYESLGRNQKLAEQVVPVLRQIGGTLLGREISKTYQKKAAAHLAKKKA